MLNFDWLANIPVESAKWIFLILFILIGVIIQLVPKKIIYEGLTEVRWWHNLKLWAHGLLAFIFVVYYAF
jgi:amino acid permease